LPQDEMRLTSPKELVTSMMTVRNVMTRSVVSVHPDTPLREVAHLLIEHRISGLPVADDAGVVLGIVSEGDFLVKEQGAEAIHHRPLAWIIGESRETQTRLAKIGAKTAGEAMTTPAITISSGRRISEAAAIMTAQRINRLPVVDGGSLVGIVTRADLVRAYVRTDDELAATIRDDVLLRSLWLDPAVFNVAVRDGSASISGHVELRSIAEMVERAVGMVPGVMDVLATVTWSTDDSRSRPALLDMVVPYSPH
jgi:CBS domain-containing protein